MQVAAGHKKSLRMETMEYHPKNRRRKMGYWKYRSVSDDAYTLWS